jgi:hypothetical protein
MATSDDYNFPEFEFDPDKLKDLLKKNSSVLLGLVHLTIGVSLLLLAFISEKK